MGVHENTTVVVMWKELQHSASAPRTFRHPRLLAFHAHAPFSTTGSGDDSTLRLKGTSKRKAPRHVMSSDSLWLPRSVSKPAYPRESVRLGAVADGVVTTNSSVDPVGKLQRVVRRRQSRGARSKLIESLKVIKRLRVRIRDALHMIYSGCRCCCASRCCCCC